MDTNNQQPVNPGEPKPFTADGIDPRLRGSANPAADLAAGLVQGVMDRMKGGGNPPPAEPPANQNLNPPPAPANPNPPPANPNPPPAPENQTPPPTPKPVSLADRYAKPDPSAPPEVPTLEPVPAQHDIRLPENTADNVGHAFAAARAETKKFRDLAESYRQQVEKVKTDYANYAQREAAITEKLTSAENRNKELEEQIGKLDLEQSPAFRAKYDDPITQKQADLADELVKSGVPAETAGQLAGQIITATDINAVQELVAQLAPAAQGIAMIRYNEADALFAQRDQALTEWRQTRTGLEQVATREGIIDDAQHRLDLSTYGLERVAAIVPQNLWNDPDFVAYRGEQEEKVKAWYADAGLIAIFRPARRFSTSRGSSTRRRVYPRRRSGPCSARSRFSRLRLLPRSPKATSRTSRGRRWIPERIPCQPRRLSSEAFSGARKGSDSPVEKCTNPLAIAWGFVLYYAQTAKTSLTCRGNFTGLIRFARSAR